MTTIAVRGGVMASDSLSTIGDWKSPIPLPKIARLSDGSLYGHSGRFAIMSEIVAWLDAGGNPESAPATTGAEFDGLLLKPDGEIWKLECEGGPIRRYAVPSLYCAIGSGSIPAMAALIAGASAEEAVKIACEMDPYSGGPVVWRRL